MIILTLLVCSMNPNINTFTYKNFECVTIKQCSDWNKCGQAYVKIPADHEFFGKHYDDLELDCHGGLTYSNYKLPTSENGPEPKEWWIGFDMCHGSMNDLAKGISYGVQVTVESLKDCTQQLVDSILDSNTQNTNNE